MTKTNRLSVLISSIFYLNSEIAFAVETTDSSSSIILWPLIVLIIVLAVFAKKLISEATPDQHESPEQATPAAAATTAIETKKKPKAPAETKAKAKKVKTKTKTKTKTIDLRDGKEQCQGSTTKGTRCKRTNTLEDTSVTIDGTRYELTVCKQHNNDGLKPFSELIK